MLPFCGYNMAYYFDHWLKMGKKSHPPKIFQVNWFRKNSSGAYIWPGFSENLRVLKWILERCHNQHQGKKTSYGLIPLEEELDLEGLSVDYHQLFETDQSVLDQEKQRQKVFLEQFGKDLPQELTKVLINT
jgi:phosphoenolpyruvate carboxykinase (GTP)